MRQFDYSDEFKIKTVRDIENGKFRNPFHAAKVLGINGKMTVYRWMEMFGKNANFVDKKSFITEIKVHMKKAPEEDNVKFLEAKIAEMQRKQDKMELELLIYQRLVEIAKDEHNLDLKKNIGLKLPSS